MATSQANLPAIRSFEDPKAMVEFKQILLSGERIEAQQEDPAEVSRRILAELLEAKSDAELFAREAVGWRNLEGLPVEITGYPRWRPSSFDEGSNVFFVVPAIRMDTGERVTLTTGAGSVLAQLVNMTERKTLVGAKLKLVKGKQTQAGFNPLRLELVEAAPGAES